MKKKEQATTEGQTKTQILREQISSNLAFLVVQALRRRQTDLTMQTIDSDPSEKQVRNRSQFVGAVNENST